MAHVFMLITYFANNDLYQIFIGHSVLVYCDAPVYKVSVRQFDRVVLHNTKCTFTLIYGLCSVI